MEIQDIRDCTQPAPSASWSATLDLAAGEFSLEAAGPGLRHLSWPGYTALVSGMPRPEAAPRPYELDADPYIAVLEMFENSGVSGLRRIEGPWSLVHWDETCGELLLAVDRLARQPVYHASVDGWWQFAGSADELALRLGLPAAPDRIHRIASGAGLAAGETVYPEIQALAPGSHLRLRRDGDMHTGVHAGWRLEKRERRPAVLVAGEFVERVKSVLRVLAETHDLILLAGARESSGVLASALGALPGASPGLLWIPGLASGQRAEWQVLAHRFRMNYLEFGAGTLAGRTPGVILNPASTREAWLAGNPGLARLAAACVLLDRQRRPGDRPLLLLSSAGLDETLPALPWPLFNPRAWSLLQGDPAPPIARTGARLARQLSSRWKPALDAAVCGTTLQVAWPLLDETVAHFLANLPEPLRIGRPWEPDFRRRVLRELRIAAA